MRKVTAKANRMTVVNNKVTLDADRPVGPEVISWPNYSVTGKQYIPFIDKSDNFFNLLLESRTQSTTLGACISTKKNYATGDGVYITNLKPNEVVDAQFADLMRSCNNNNDNLTDVVRSIIGNLYTFGNCCVEFVKGTTAGRKFLKVYVRNTLDCRLEWPNEYYEVDNVIISKSFRKQGVIRLDKATNIKLPLYKSSLGYKSNEWYRDAETGVERICVWIKNDFEGYDHYGLPSYVAALVSTQCEYQGARYNLDNFENNMVVGGALTITGSVSQEEAQRIATDLMNTHTGNGKRGRITVIATEGGLTDSKYEKHDTFEDGSYIELDDKSTQKIILANEWDATLAGLQQSGSMGKGNEYVKAIYEQKVATVIKPMHRLIKDRFFNVLKEIGAAWLSPAIAQYDLDIKVMDLFKDSSKITGTKEGVEAIMGILDRVSAKTMTPEQAISLVAWQWNLTPTEAAEKLAFVKNK